MRIALMRSGTVLYSDNRDASPVAGNQDALGVLRYLKQSGHDVCIFGSSKGPKSDTTREGLEKAFGVPVFSPNFSGLSIKGGVDGGACIRPPSGEYDLAINWALAELKQWEPQICINVAGQQPSHSNPGNPWGCKPLYTAISTNYPMLKAVQDLRLPRVVIINDPRNLPRELEGIYMPGTLPVAVLSQRSKVTPWKPERAARSLRREEAYAACENWWTYGMPYASLEQDRSGITVIAHSHSHDLRVYGPERANTWQKVLSKCSSAYDIYGQGWEDSQVKNHWKGLITHDQVQGVLQKSSQGPMICLEKGFATGKLREYVVAGALPRPVSFGKFHYDYDNRYLAANHPARIKEYDSWSEITWSEAKGYVEELRIKSTPNFDPLEDVIARVVAGQPHSWGGYRWA